MKKIQKIFHTKLLPILFVGVCLCSLFGAGAHQNVYLGYEDLSKADLRFTNLFGADLEGAILHEADFCFADLQNASFHNSDLTGASFCNADLRGAKLENAKLDGVNFHGAVVDQKQAEYLSSKGYKGFIIADKEDESHLLLVKNPRICLLPNDPYREDEFEW